MLGSVWWVKTIVIFFPSLLSYRVKGGTKYISDMSCTVRRRLLSQKEATFS